MSHSYQNNNNGFDRQGGFYKVIIGDHIAYRFEVLKELDRGAFGQVIRCLDHKTKREVAVKINKCINVQHNNTCRAEAAIMQRLRDTECDDSLNAYKGHIVHYIDNFLFRNHYCFVVELLGKNLYADLKENGYKGFELKSKLRHVIFQIV